MGIVSFIVDAANNGLNDVAQSQFAAVAAGMGGTIMIASTFAVILLFINMSLQWRPMDGVELFPLLIKIALINAFALTLGQRRSECVLRRAAPQHLGTAVKDRLGPTQHLN